MRVYLDHQASTPVLPEVLEAMLPYYKEHFGGASSLHQQGHIARRALEKAREQLASLIHSESAEEIIFTSSGTESINLAIKGTAWANKRRGNHIILSAIEHPAVIHSVEFLETQGFCADRVPVEPDGKIVPELIAAAIRPETLLICVHHCNHDIGTIQNLEAIGQIAGQHAIPLFIDATASAGWLPIHVQKVNASLLALSPHRFYGPKGVGVLYRNRRSRLIPLIHGGEQEGSRRAGTENIPSIVGAGLAAEIAVRDLPQRAAHTAHLQELTWLGLSEAVPFIRLNGPAPGPDRSPAHLNVSIQFLEGEGLALALDVKGFAIASGAACITKNLKIPPVLSAIGVNESFAQGTILLSFGKDNTVAEIKLFLETAPKVIALLREMSPLWNDFYKRMESSAAAVGGSAAAGLIKT